MGAKCDAFEHVTHIFSHETTYHSFIKTVLLSRQLKIHKISFTLISVFTSFYLSWSINSINMTVRSFRNENDVILTCGTNANPSVSWNYFKIHKDELIKDRENTVLLVIGGVHGVERYVMKDTLFREGYYNNQNPKVC